jgi:hypothetical protein
MKRLLLPNLIEIIEYYNKINGKKLLHSPQINPLTESKYQFIKILYHPLFINFLLPKNNAELS